MVAEAGAGLDREEVLRHARKHLIEHKVPRVVELREDLPRSPTGKVLRGELLAEGAGSP